MHVAILQALYRDFAAVREVNNDFQSLISQHNMPVWIATERLFSAIADTADGPSLQTVAGQRDALDQHQSVIGGPGFCYPTFSCWLAEAYLSISEPANALGAIATGLEVMQVTKEVWYEPELHRVRGIALAIQGEASAKDEAEAALRRALELARSRSAKSLELRAATSLARLLGEQGKGAEARDLLAPVYGWFTEGFDTADLMEAKALLEELS